MPLRDRDKPIIIIFSIVMVFILVIGSIVLLELSPKPLSTATYDELIEIQAIGEHKANLILEYIETHENCTVDDLDEIKGISTTIVERLSKCYR